MIWSPNDNAGSHRVNVANRAWYSVGQVEGCVVVTAGGEVDAQTAPALREALEVAAEFSTKIVLDLSHVTVLEPAALNVLADARVRIREHQGSVVLVAADEPVRATLREAGVPEALIVVERVAEALGRLAGLGDKP